MRISDIEIMRGDSDMLVDPSEPYGTAEPHEPEDFLLALSGSEKKLLILYLDEKRKTCNQALNHMNPKPKKRQETLRRVRLIHGLLDKLRGTNLNRHDPSI